ncbi:MAG: hypothetical protein E7609_03745 [Ruminococcaceae bacterium]|nr:hypothetical protein [Oscillospiraceae bacterium]
MTNTERTLAKLNGTLEKEYGALVTRKLRTRYSLSDELAAQRKRESDPEGFAAYDAFAEACKREARKEIYGEEESV